VAVRSVRHRWSAESFASASIGGALGVLSRPGASSA